jgi:hypothetical protein
MKYLITVQNDTTHDIKSMECKSWYYTDIIEEAEKFLNNLNEIHPSEGFYEILSIVRIGEIK